MAPRLYQRPVRGNCKRDARERDRTIVSVANHSAKLEKEYFTTDAEMFAMYASETEGSVEMVKEHAEHLVQQIARIVEQGIQSKELKPGNPETIARAIFLATSRFHHPAHAQHWLADEEEDDFQLVWELLLRGLV